MKQLYEIISNDRIAEKIYKMVIYGDVSPLYNPGQFVNILIDGLYLRRPISVSDWKKDEGDTPNGTITLIYKVVGRGTERMAEMTCGMTLDILCGLGNGFDPKKAAGRKIMLIGGGVGVPPLIGLARELRKQGENDISAALGFENAAAVFGIDELEALGVNVHTATVDGSAGEKGFVTAILEKAEYDYYFVCGPQAMLRAIHRLGHSGQLSFEERMGCGFGACMGCTCHTLVGNKRVCMDGPVFLSEEVSFDEQT